MAIRPSKIIRVLETASEVIDALGGTTSAGELLGYKPARISNWRSRGRLPPETYTLINELLADRGFSAPRALWGMIEPVRAPVAAE